MLKKEAERRKRSNLRTPFTSYAPDKQTPWMSIGREGGNIPNMNVDFEDSFLQTRDKPHWDKNSSFIRRQNDVEVDQAMVQRVKKLYESNPDVANAVEIFLREIWRGGISITVHFGNEEKMVFSKDDKMTSQYFSERLTREMRNALRDCLLYGFACVRIHEPKIVEVEIEETKNPPGSYVDEEALKAEMPDDAEELLILLEKEMQGASFASDTLQVKTNGDGSDFFDGEKRIQSGKSIRRMKGSNQLVFDDPDPEAQEFVRIREEFFSKEKRPTVAALKSQLLAARLSNQAVEQMARGQGGGSYLPKNADDSNTTGDDDLDAYPSFVVLDVDRVTQYIRVNEKDRREYYVMYNGHTMNRNKQPVPQGMMLVLNDPTLSGVLQSPVAKVLPLASQLADLWRNFGLVNYTLARPFMIATVETDKSDPHVASRTMAFGNAAQDGTDDAMKKYSETIELRRQDAQETHEIVVDPRYEQLVHEKKEMQKSQHSVNNGESYFHGLRGNSNQQHIHPLLDETGSKDPTDLRDEPYLRKCVFPANSRLLPNPIPSIPANMLDVARYFGEQIFVAMGLPAEMYMGGQRRFASNQTLDQMIQDSRIQEFQNAMSTLFQTLLSRVFDPLIDEHVFNKAVKNGHQTNSSFLRNYKAKATILVEFHFNVHISEEQLVLYIEQGWLDEKAAQTFALRQASIDPKFATKDPVAARRKRAREMSQDQEKPHTDIEREKLQTAKSIATKDRQSSERTAAKAMTAANSSKTASSSSSKKQK